MFDFPSTLKSRIEEKGLSAADASTAIGVSAPSLRTALSGSSFPNARSLAKYASFLGRSEEETKALIAASKPAAGEKKAKKIKLGKASAKAAKSVKSAKVGSKKSSSAAEALAVIAAAIKQADSLANDELAVAVHRLGNTPRKLIESIIKTFG